MGNLVGSFSDLAYVGIGGFMQAQGITRIQAQTVLRSGEALQKGQITEAGRKMILVFASIPKDMINKIMQGKLG